MAGTNVYIDGFNLYYGCIRNSPYRWLDIEAFCQRLLPSETIKRIRYFTARVSATPNDPGAPSRQAIYLRALGTLPKVSIHYGHFLTNRVWMPLVNPPASGPKKAQVLKTEEKGSDVNLAAFALLDAFQKDCDTVVIISNDSDLKEPVSMLRYELGMKVGVINPHPPNRRSRVLSKEANFFKQIRPQALATSQFNPTLTDAVGKFHKPKGW